MNIKTKIIKGLDHNIFVDNLEKFKKQNNLVECGGFFAGACGFFSKKNQNKKRYIIKKWYSCGEWAYPRKETYCYLIENN